MIDVSQWRASIGLWNYSQAASSRPANDHYSHLFKAEVDSKSAASGEKLLTALILITFLIFLCPSYTLLKYIFVIPSNGNISNYECQSTCTTVIDTNSSDTCTYKLVYLLLLLLMSGDIEVNPGPTIDDKPSRHRFAKYLKPLVTWKSIASFALCLPGITRSFVKTLNGKYCVKNTKMKLHMKWLKVNSHASWTDVIIALKQCNEDKLARAIEAKVTKSTIITHSTADTNTGALKGNPKEIFRTHLDRIGHAISVNLCIVTTALYAKGLIPKQTKGEMLVTAVDDITKAFKLVNVMEHQLEGSLNPEQYLIDTCYILMNQKHYTLTDIATSMLQQLVSRSQTPPSVPLRHGGWGVATRDIVAIGFSAINHPVVAKNLGLTCETQTSNT
uniref:Uncharacterized protein n=1 Tax=Amphimedon queenslandica TaxID=400682 RepID=A0A1X7T3F8_AMPQE